MYALHHRINAPTPKQLFGIGDEMLRRRPVTTAMPCHELLLHEVQTRVLSWMQGRGLVRSREVATGLNITLFTVVAALTGLRRQNLIESAGKKDDSLTWVAIAKSRQILPTKTSAAIAENKRCGDEVLAVVRDNTKPVETREIARLAKRSLASVRAAAGHMRRREVIEYVDDDRGKGKGWVVRHR